MARVVSAISPPSSTRARVRTANGRAAILLRRRTTCQGRADNDEASSPEAIRRHSERANLAVDEIVAVAVRPDPATVA
jgi:hypothetical protein